jgi:hypothetical protein
MTATMIGSVTRLAQAAERIIDDLGLDGGATASYFHGELAPQWPVGLTAFSSAPNANLIVR